MSHRGGHKKKRVRDNGGWGTYYANKNRNKRDRYDELDPSASRPVNGGPQQQHTLARRRRQLPENNNNNKYRTPALSQKGEDIFQDLVLSHIENKSFSNNNNNNNNNNNRLKANPMIINSRKSFWKRKLSSLSTRDFDVVWKEGRNKFLKHIHNQGTGQGGSNAPPPAAAAAGGGSGGNVDKEPTTNRRDLKDPSPSGLEKSKNKAGDGSKSKAGKSIAPITVNGHAAQSTTKAQKSSSTTTTSNEVRFPNGSQDTEVIDLCDTDSDDTGSDEKNETTNNKDKLAGGASKENQLIGRVGNPNAHPTKKEVDVSGSGVEAPSRPRQPQGAVAAAAAPNPTTSPAPDPPLMKPSTPSIRSTRITAENRKVTEDSTTDRWAKFFLGPDFRTDHIFSLDDKEGDR